MSSDRSMDLLDIKLLVRDKNEVPLINFPVHGRYVDGVKIVEKYTDSSGHIRFKLKPDSKFEVQVYTVRNAFESNVILDSNSASMRGQVIVSVEHLASEYMGTLNVLIVDLDKKPVVKAKFIRHYMNSVSEKIADETGRKKLKALLDIANNAAYAQRTPISEFNI